MVNRAWKKSRFRLALVSLIGSVLLGVAATLSLTEIGRLLLLRTGLSLVNANSAWHIQTQGVSSPSWGHWQWQALDLYHAQNLVAETRQGRLLWQADALWQRELRIDRLSLKHLTLHRPLPTGSDREASSGGQLPNLINQALPGLWLDELIIDRWHWPANGDNQRPLPDTALQGQARWPQQQPLQLQLSLRSLEPNPFQADAAMTARPAKQGPPALQVSLTLQEPEPGRLARALHLPKQQNIDARARGLVTLDEQQWRLALESFAMPWAEHQIRASGDLTLAADFSRADSRGLNLWVDDRRQRLSGSWQDERIEAALELQQLPLSLLRPWQLPLQEGQASGSMTLKGPLMQPHMAGQLALDSHYQGRPLSLRVTAQGTQARAEIERLQLDWGDSHGQLQGVLEWQQQRMDLTLALQQVTLADVQAQPWLPSLALPPQLSLQLQSAEGQLQGPLRDPDADLQLRLAGQYQQQDFTAQGRVTKQQQQMRFAPLQINLPEGQAQLQGSLQLGSWETELSLQADRLPLSLLALAKVELPRGLSGLASGKVRVSGPISAPKVSANAHLDGRLDRIDFKLTSQAQWAAGRLGLQKLELSTFGKPTASLTGFWQGQQWDLQLAADRLPSRLLRTLELPAPEGDLTARLHLSGSRDRPELAGHLSYRIALGELTGSKDSRPLMGQLTLATEQQTLRLLNRLQLQGSPPITLSAQLPLAPYLAALQNPATPLAGLPLNGDLRGQMDLASLQFLWDSELYQVAGTLASDLQLSGSLAAPKLSGQVSLQDGNFENPGNALFLRKVNCQLQARGRQLRLERCRTNESNQGDLQLTGTVLLPTARDPGQVNLAGSLANARLLRREDLDGRISGDVTLTGAFDDLLLQGQLNVSPLTANLDAGSDTGIPKIEVVREQTQASRPKPLPNIALDLSIAADKQAFVRGQGLDAELKGEVFLKGNLKQPRLEGKLETVRGAFEIFSRRFVLENGEISSINNAIAMDITGTYKRREQSITANLSGIGDNIKLKLTADPSMPEDEIMAFVIFGKSVQDISAFEAIQLASAIQSLRGGKSLDLIGGARDLLGVDALTINTETSDKGETGVNVGIGKYLNERVYLELERTPNPSQPWKGNLDIELTPNINLESATGGTTGLEGVELKWKKDY